MSGFGQDPEIAFQRFNGNGCGEVRFDASIDQPPSVRPFSAQAVFWVFSVPFLCLFFSTRCRNRSMSCPLFCIKYTPD